MKRIIPAITKVFRDEAMEGEVIVVDDNSPDGTASIALNLAGSYPVKVHVRKSGRGLSRAVIEGLGLARGEICVVMDADLSHPVEKIPDMIQPILEGKCDATVGSRYVVGGGAQNWPLLRRIVSKGAVAKGVTVLSDPTSGFMAVRRSVLDGVTLDPLGWKIVLEVVVKTRARVLDVPIIFADREEGESKLGLKAQVDYLRHLGRLYAYRYPLFFEFVKFCLVGLTGLVVDTAVLVSLVDHVSLDPRFAAVFAFREIDTHSTQLRFLRLHLSRRFGSSDRNHASLDRIRRHGRKPLVYPGQFHRDCGCHRVQLSGQQIRGVQKQT